MVGITGYLWSDPERVEGLQRVPRVWGVYGRREVDWVGWGKTGGWSYRTFWRMALGTSRVSSFTRTMS